MGTMLRYDDMPTDYMGTSFTSSTVESVYSIKSGDQRPKDITDMSVLKPHIDEKKLEALKEHPIKKVELKNVKPNNNTEQKEL